MADLANLRGIGWTFASVLAASLVSAPQTTICPHRPPRLRNMRTGHRGAAGACVARLGSPPVPWVVRRGDRHYNKPTGEVGPGARYPGPGTKGGGRESAYDRAGIVVDGETRHGQT
ncbi:hypothetical protein C8R45DRAFT_562101 [Mycena sanguinolenta]|nr:hypothetical protein C8R45DRAFT_562101 [Mycena sanguinolenta]